ncbi:uncharacterized protein PHALS_06158 [Plasmopara halstedii]|uniref:Uncharacterized protein n=1 Tax=Plasmopara halstedii TaxID=4781 RepID=A0A0N7L7Y0_PLAHL|nr:uncharacterized protein PHALS_06158 [Plasmopara halstedii]CEG48331.1 hypothetical protein PHALS_06158 [Plasmopara halstedii]|eukprot:XP_024584700.1 hypothetical protein PHALS_06158 [Plasmopara halstedii]
MAISISKNTKKRLLKKALSFALLCSGQSHYLCIGIRKIIEPNLLLCYMLDNFVASDTCQLFTSSYVRLMARHKHMRCLTRENHAPGVAFIMLVSTHSLALSQMPYTRVHELNLVNSSTEQVVSVR